MSAPGERAARVRLRRVEPPLRRALRGDCRLEPGATLLVAVSGGADSTALLVALASVAHEQALDLHAAHLHHGLRGREADGDARAVQRLCARIGVPLSLARWDCRARMRRRGLAGEAGLRTLRREWLRRVARATGAAAIATAHTADDQLETLLMRLARGTGLAGAPGMRARRGRWLKPLLHVTRADIELDLRRHGLTWREDASNVSPGMLRNRIRHVAVPALLDAMGVRAADPVARRAPLARRAAAHAADLARAAHALEARAARGLARARRPGQDAAWDAGLLNRLGAPVLQLALRRAWRLAGEPGSPGLTGRQLDPILAAIARPGSRSARVEVALPHGWTARLAGGVLRFDTRARAIGGARRASRQRAASDARLPGTRRRARTGPVEPRTARRRTRGSSSLAHLPARPAGTQERP